MISMRHSKVPEFSKRVGIGFLALAFFGGCSVDTVGSHEVQPHAIHQNFWLSYGEETNSTEFSATFRVGGPTGTTVKLVAPAELQVDGNAVESSTFLGTHYRKSIAKSYKQSATIYWLDANKKGYTNVLTIHPVAIPAQLPAVRLGSEYTIAVSAPSFGPGDQISATISQRQGTEATFSSSYAYDEKRGVVIFRYDEVARLKPGKAKVSVTSTNSGKLQETTAEGGYGSASYYTKSVEIDVEGNGTDGTLQSMAQR